MESASVSAYDAIAPRFERDRALPDGIVEAIRAAVHEAAGAAWPRLLDLGCGTGRIGWPFVAAGDDYVGADLSLGMLREFAQRAAGARLVQADGHRLPFGDAAFDAVLLVQVFGGMSAWEEFAAEVSRVLRPRGTVLIGRTAAPDDGVDARMKVQLDAILGADERRGNNRRKIEDLFGARAVSRAHRSVASWRTQRTPRQFIARHRGGARFSHLPEPVKDDAMEKLAAWAEQTFGSLDAASDETHAFELNIYRFQGAA